jgi:hypothetical protein
MAKVLKEFFFSKGGRIMSHAASSLARNQLERSTSCLPSLFYHSPSWHFAAVLTTPSYICIIAADLPSYLPSRKGVRERKNCLLAVCKPSVNARVTGRQSYGGRWRMGESKFSFGLSIIIFFSLNLGLDFLRFAQ